MGWSASWQVVQCWHAPLLLLTACIINDILCNKACPEPPAAQPVELLPAEEAKGKIELVDATCNTVPHLWSVLYII
jgi:hypothetical protein